MGNCLVLQTNEAIKVMKPDGKIIEYKTPMKVIQVLSKFPCHSISDTEAGQDTGRIVRVKLVISKQELEAMIRKGRVSVDDMVSDQLLKKLYSKEFSRVDGDRDSKGWKPVLESIVEAS